MDAALKTVLCAVAMLLLSAASASAQLGEYDTCGAVGDVTIVAVSNASCQDVAGPAASIAGAPPDQATTLLRAAGWMPLRSAATDGATAFDLVAVRG
ncbi:MAG TPA: hypothetical protein VGR11_15150, partial [Solirubrobacteraceae bacterium]|nr:hypothetical protein [Solirubrobacteraceae bacterium]